MSQEEIARNTSLPVLKAKQRVHKAFLHATEAELQN